MKLIRKSLLSKALFLFFLLGAGLVMIATISIRRGIFQAPLIHVFGGITLLLIAILVLFIWNVFSPLRRITREVKALLSGKSYKRLEPTTIDETGVLTHFFNEITRDLEKISYDMKERKRMSSELDIAAQIQRDVLPKTAPDLQGFDVIAKTRAAAEIGGDCFDFLQSPDAKQFFMYVGDVTGHGVPAGLVMMMVDTLVSSMVANGVSTGRDIMVKTNQLVTPRISNRIFMTAVMLRWDKEQKKMFYTGAGHEHILIYRAKTETVEAIRSGGIALAMIPDNSKILQEKEIPLEVGDTIVLYSDGITEAKNQTGEMYTLDRVVKSVKTHGFKPTSESIFDGITKDFATYVGEYVQIDDCTLIVIKYTGEAGPAKKIQLAVSSDEAAHKSKIWDWNS
jgi:serine phosphatase RsbU (regulator of sigma subunit)